MIGYMSKISLLTNRSLMARFMGPTWGPSGADRAQVGPMNFAIWDETATVSFATLMWGLHIQFKGQLSKNKYTFRCISLYSIISWFHQYLAYSSTVICELWGVFCELFRDNQVLSSASYGVSSVSYLETIKYCHLWVMGCLLWVI